MWRPAAAAAADDDDDKAQNFNDGSESMADHEEVVVVAVTTSVDHHHHHHQKGSSSSATTSVHDDDDDFQTVKGGRWGSGVRSAVSEIEEEEEEEEHRDDEQHSSTSTSTRRKKVFDLEKSSLGLDSIREEDDHHDDVYYVALLQGNGIKATADQDSASMDALLWTLNQAASTNHHPSPIPTTTTTTTTTLLFLVHVVPEIKHIPTPLGMMAVSQVNPEQKEIYMAQERAKHSQFLNKFLHAASSSPAKIKVDTIVIESDMEAKAILDLIPILNISKLVLGTTKSVLRKMRSRRSAASGTLDEIVKGAPEFCQLKIICEGKQMQLLDSSDSPSPTHSPRPQPPDHIITNNNNHTSQSPPPVKAQHRSNGTTSANYQSFSCRCFKPPKVHS